MASNGRHTTETENIEGIKTNKHGKQYVSNPYLLEEIYKSRERGELTPTAWKMFELMIKNISAAKHYNNPDDREDCCQSARFDLLKYWKSFDPSKYEKPNPFAYFTSVIINGMNKGWMSLYGKFKASEMISLDNNIHSL